MPKKAELNQEFGTTRRIDSTFQNHIAQGGCQEKEQSSFWYFLNSLPPAGPQGCFYISVHGINKGVRRTDAGRTERKNGALQE